MRCSHSEQQRARRTDDSRKSRPPCSIACARASPRVHCITNAVAQNFTANVLLAAGAVPSMTLSRRGNRRRSLPAPTRCWSISAPSIASAARRPRSRWKPPARQRALGARSGVHRPQPAARGLRPRTGRAARHKRCGSTAPNFRRLPGSEPTREALAVYARASKTVIGLSGATDWVGDGERFAAIANGHALMAKVTAMGCAASALVAACLAVEPDAWRAVAAALVDRSASPANWRPARRAGPGSFAVAILDALHNLDAPTLIASRARKGELMDVDLRLYALVDPAVAGGRTAGRSRRR